MKSKNKKKDDGNQRVKQPDIKKENASNERKVDHSAPSIPSYKVIFICAVCCGMVNMFHVSSIFENDRHFSHLSNLEREMTFRTEMGLYYSYYKEIVEAGSFVSGFNKLLYNNKTEYPDTINTLQRFNLYPEVVLAGTYRMLCSVVEYFRLDMPKVCWQVHRGDDMEPVVSCEGLGDPFYWYLNGVWLSAGTAAALLFVHGCQLSYSLAGGFLAVASFFFNHADATRIQWAPPLRESFAFQYSVALGICVTMMMRLERRKSWLLPFTYGTLALMYMLCWQLSHYTLVLHLVIAYAMYSVRMINAFPMLLLLVGGYYAFINNLVLQFGNSLLLASPYAGTLIGILLLYLFLEPIIQHFPFPMNVALQLSCVFISSAACKLELARFLEIEDDAHIVNIVRAKLTRSYADFHTLLYTCAAEFDFLPRDTLHRMCGTLLVPCVLLAAGCVASNTLGLMRDNFARRMRQKQRTINVWEGVDAGVTYNFLLLVAYGVMATLVMRLKLFFTPQLCVMTSLLASRRYWAHIVSRRTHSALLVCLVAGMAVQGSRNIVQQRSIVGEYRNANLEQLIHWVNGETAPGAVFAGPMSTMANVMLSTGRPIVNHPHYENSALRTRTKNVYSIFSRRSPDRVYATLLALKVNYVVIASSWCFGHGASRPGCRMVDLWDVEEPHNRRNQPLCPKLFKNTPAPFHKVFSNDEYVVLEVPSKYIEILPPRMLSE